MLAFSVLTCRIKRKYRTFVCAIIKLPQVYILYMNSKHIINFIYSYHDSFMYKLPAFYAYLQRILFTNFMESCRHGCFSVPLPSFMIPFCGRHCQGNVQAVCAFTCQYQNRIKSSYEIIDSKWKYESPTLDLLISD